MSAHQDISSYIASARAKGFTDEAIKLALIQAGWDQKDIQQAFHPEIKQEVEKKPLSPVIIIISIFLFLLLGGGAAYGLYWYQTQPKPTPTPTAAAKESTLSPTPIASASALQPADDKTSSVSAELITAYNTFGFTLLKQLAKEKSSNNIVLSPPGIGLALSMTYNGASESTKLVIGKTLGVNGIDMQTLNSGNAILMSMLQQTDSAILFANSIWTKKDISFLPSFLKVNTDYYNAYIQSLDFSLSSAADTINTWVSKQTKGHIPTIVTKPIDPTIVMYLINAIYFSGDWTYEFDPTQTTTLPFTLSDGTTMQYPHMQQSRNDFLYQETNVFQALMLPYGKTKRLAMTVILPKSTLSAFVSQLTPAAWTSWMQSFAEAEGTVILPKMHISYETSLKQALTTLGMGPAFSTQSADFSGMRKQKDLYISDVKHETSIDIDEKGTQATAVTSVEIGLLQAAASTKKPFTMKLQKPFFFAITDTLTKEILFIGTIMRPNPAAY